MVHLGVAHYDKMQFMFNDINYCAIKYRIKLNALNVSHYNLAVVLLNFIVLLAAFYDWEIVLQGMLIIKVYLCHYNYFNLILYTIISNNYCCNWTKIDGMFIFVLYLCLCYNKLIMFIPVIRTLYKLWSIL